MEKLIKHLNLTSDLHNYILTHNPEENINLQNLRITTDKLKYCRLRSPTEQIYFIMFLLKFLKPKNVLELGTFTGYATLAMALATDRDTQIITCDINDVFPIVGKEFWEAAQVEQKIQLILGPAINTLNQLKKDNFIFDFIYIDADKENYSKYFKLSLAMLSKNGIIAVDNVLWHGSVADVNVIDPRAKAIHNFNQIIKSRSDINYCLLPFCDGITLVSKL